MAFKKGMSGNPTGRPKQTQEQKEEREQFKALLKSSTVPALESIIAIANDRFNKDRYNACRFIIEKAYGANTAFLLDGTEETEPIVIEVLSHRMDRNEEDKAWEAEWNSAPDNQDDEIKED